jgi:hypothetical protein
MEVVAAMPDKVLGLCFAHVRMNLDGAGQKQPEMIVFHISFPFA